MICKFVVTSPLLRTRRTTLIVCSLLKELSLNQEIDILNFDFTILIVISSE
ncbi:hypothetical protein JCM19039_933 [Geomicrobium sp. JCM 19039]|nr:hypothetical protein JCM19039_933 [Geomicrobium sp. JCM 19039]